MRALGIDLGGHFIKGALIEDRSVAARNTVPTPESRSPGDVIDAIVALVTKLDPDGTEKTVGVGFQILGE